MTTILIVLLSFLTQDIYIQVLEERRAANVAVALAARNKLDKGFVNRIVRGQDQLLDAVTVGERRWIYRGMFVASVSAVAFALILA